MKEKNGHSCKENNNNKKSIKKPKTSKYELILWGFDSWWRCGVIMGGCSVLYKCIFDF